MIAEEYWDVYDKNRERTGKILKRGDPVLEGEYHLLTQAWIVNSKGEWLISKRANLKFNPYKWEPTNGSVIAGEDSLQGAIREVKEELGITLDPESGTLFWTMQWEQHDKKKAAFMDIWVFEADVSMDEIVLEEEEVCQVKWATAEDIYHLIEVDAFIPMDGHNYFDSLMRFKQNK